MSRAAMQQALDALEEYMGTALAAGFLAVNVSRVQDHVDALRAALAAPQPQSDAIDYAERYADAFNDSPPSRLDVVNAVYWGMRFKGAALAAPQPQADPMAALKVACDYIRGETSGEQARVAALHAAWDVLYPERAQGAAQ